VLFLAGDHLADTGSRPFEHCLCIRWTRIAFINEAIFSVVGWEKLLPFPMEQHYSLRGEEIGCKGDCWNRWFQTEFKLESSFLPSWGVEMVASVC
jgi:hypothetical protein